MEFGIRRRGGKGLILCLFLTLCAVAPAHAEDPAPLPVTSVAAPAAATAGDPVRDLIARQMEAIRDRDAEQAFAHTTAAFHEHYNTAQNFLSHVRFEYRPLYNHKEFAFLDSHEIDGGGLLQKVKVEDSYGDSPVTVIFRLQKQDDGQWLIDSFTILGGGDDGRPI